MVCALLHSIVTSIENDRHSHHLNKWKQNMDEWNKNKVSRFQDMLISPTKKNKKKFKDFKKAIFEKVKELMNVPHMHDSTEVFHCISEFSIPGFSEDDDDELFNYLEINFEEWTWHISYTRREFRKKLLTFVKNKLNNKTEDDYLFLLDHIYVSMCVDNENLYAILTPEIKWTIRIDEYNSGRDDSTIKFQI